MTKKKENKLKCLCCDATVYQSDLRRTLGREVWIWGVTRKLEFADLVHGQYQFACDSCLESGRAIIGTPQRQLYCDFDPYLAFFDLNKTCENCAKDYVFTKEEQQSWYEKLRFWVQSKPKYCADCRRKKRQRKRMNKELSDILSKKENLGIEDMERLSEIYKEINRPDKSQYYQNLIEKYKRKTATNTA
ncbi:hypothetical protein GU926_05045 [Nibribacter ruber]|uniref:Probable zinc-binding domain-containing protein n=1 Tax=Nibribacter ruber TaxID=2698458 RepID=A0A6P1NSZ9_9BACT|nr:zinc-ribbon domain containing protein [Nibribacter ruber]QHL86837.1 hypothetical protein GU926_05045 [Nibribacter ruber]